MTCRSFKIRCALIALFTALTLSPALAQTSVIENLDGPVTTDEIASFKNAIASLVPGDSNHHNNYAYGNSGDAMEACGDMFDVTKDRAILEKLILFCDKLVSIRNTTRVMWTGDKDPVWPNNTNNIWGCEQSDVAGHLAYCAQLISENPALWNDTVGIGDTNNYGKTYKARAMTYLSVVDQTMELFYKHNFIHTNDLMETPPTPPWPDAHSGGKAVPWNQQAMLCSALVRGADAHERFHDDSSRIKQFRNTARASIKRFLAQCANYKFSKDGKSVCKWSYSGGTFPAGQPIRYTEDIAHGGYDVVAVWRARHWLPGAVTDADGRMLADTLMENIRSGERFWSRVDGSGSLKKRLGVAWTDLSEFRSDVFTATTRTGAQYYADAARKLWIKNARNKGWPPAV